MNERHIAGSPSGERWGEAVLIGAAAPGILAGAVLGAVLVAQASAWQGNVGLLGDAFALLAVATPSLAILGGLTLVAGAIAAPFVPGRASRRWGALILGTIAWSAAFYWLHVPGLIELP